MVSEQWCEAIDGSFREPPICRDLATEYRQQRRAAGCHLERVVACHARRIARWLIEKRTHAAVAPDDIAATDLLCEVAIDDCAQVVDFLCIDTCRGRLAVEIDVGRADQR